MNPGAFRETLGAAAPAAGMSLALQALWWDAKGDWDRAHACAMQDDSWDGSAVHAYLHRKEGDLSNAGYWYARAGKARAEGALEAEWQSLVDAVA